MPRFLTGALTRHFQSRLAVLARGNQESHRFVLAVSGGLDSMVMAHLALETLEPQQCTIAHFNHRSRGKESDQDEAFVHAWALRHGMAFERAERLGNSLSEASLRRERHAFLDRVRSGTKSDYVLLAHHLEDQFETFLMRILRGTGVRGLAGMAPKQGTKLRPLLRVSRLELERYAEKNEVKWRVDSSNQEVKYFRNQIRHGLTAEFYALAETYGGRERFLARFEQMRLELKNLASSLERQSRVEFAGELHTTPYWTRIARDFFLSRSRIKQQQILRSIWASLGVEVPSRQTVTRVRKTILLGQRQLSVFEMEVSESCGFLYFQTKQQYGKAPKLHFEISNSRVRCAELGLVLRVTGNKRGLEWRQWQAGDRFGSRKLKELFLEARIPKLERALLPVLAKIGSSEVAWYYPRSDEGVIVKELGFTFAGIFK